MNTSELITIFHTERETGRGGGGRERERETNNKNCKETLDYV